MKNGFWLWFRCIIVAGIAFGLSACQDQAAVDFIPAIIEQTIDEDTQSFDGPHMWQTIDEDTTDFTPAIIERVIDRDTQSFDHSHVWQTIDEDTTDFTLAIVERVIDGDTIVIYGGYRVRLIGVDAPEMGFFGGIYEAGATEATKFVRYLLPIGQAVWLESVGNDTDRFGRLRRYVWLEIPTDPNDPHQRRRMTVNGLLLEYGHAVVWP